MLLEECSMLHSGGSSEFVALRLVIGGSLHVIDHDDFDGHALCVQAQSELFLNCREEGRLFKE